MKTETLNKEIFSTWLKTGEQTLIIEEAYKQIYFTRINRNENFDILFFYDIFNAGTSKKITTLPLNVNLTNCGIYCRKNGKIYDPSYDVKTLFGEICAGTRDSLMREFEQAVQKKVEATINNDKANLDIKNLSDSESILALNQHEHWYANGLARHIFLLAPYGKEKVSYHCEYHRGYWVYDEYYENYILEPEKCIEDTANDYIQCNQEKILLQFMMNDITQKKIDEIKADKENELHTVKKIMNIMKDHPARKVKITIKKDESLFVFHYDPSVFIRDNTSYSDYYMDAADRKEFEKKFGYKLDSFYPSEIQSITYGKKVLYSISE